MSCCFFIFLFCSVSIKNIITFIIRSKDKVHACHTQNTHKDPQSPWGRMLSEGACHWPHLWRLMHCRQASWAARNTDYNVSTQQLQKCAWLIPDVFKIQTAFRNLVGASEGNKTDGVPILPSQYLPKLLYFSFYYLTGMQERSLLPFEEQATFLPSLQSEFTRTPSWQRSTHAVLHPGHPQTHLCPSSMEAAVPPCSHMEETQLTCVCCSWGTLVVNLHIRTMWHQHRNNRKS